MSNHANSSGGSPSLPKLNLNVNGRNRVSSHALSSLAPPSEGDDIYTTPGPRASAVVAATSAVTAVASSSSSSSSYPSLPTYESPLKRSTRGARTGSSTVLPQLQYQLSRRLKQPVAHMDAGIANGTENDSERTAQTPTRKSGRNVIGASPSSLLRGRDAGHDSDAEREIKFKDEVDSDVESDFDRNVRKDQPKGKGKGIQVPSPALPQPLQPQSQSQQQKSRRKGKMTEEASDDELRMVSQSTLTASTSTPSQASIATLTPTPMMTVATANRSRRRVKSESSELISTVPGPSKGTRRGSGNGTSGGRDTTIGAGASANSRRLARPAVLPPVPVRPDLRPGDTINDPSNPNVHGCPYCEKVYTGQHARSICRRHQMSKHGIELDVQVKKSRWDNNPNRPATEEEKHQRTLESKRRWAAKDRRRRRCEKLGIPFEDSDDNLDDRDEDDLLRSARPRSMSGSEASSSQYQRTPAHIGSRLAFHHRLIQNDSDDDQAEEQQNTSSSPPRPALISSPQMQQHRVQLSPVSSQQPMMNYYPTGVMTTPARSVSSGHVRTPSNPSQPLQLSLDLPPSHKRVAQVVSPPRRIIKPAAVKERSQLLPPAQFGSSGGKKKDMTPESDSDEEAAEILLAISASPARPVKEIKEVKEQNKHKRTTSLLQQSATADDLFAVPKQVKADIDDEETPVKQTQTWPYRRRRASLSSVNEMDEDPFQPPSLRPSTRLAHDVSSSGSHKGGVLATPITPATRHMLQPALDLDRTARLPSAPPYLNKDPFRIKPQDDSALASASILSSPPLDGTDPSKLPTSTTSALRTGVTPYRIHPRSTVTPARPSAIPASPALFNFSSPNGLDITHKLGLAPSVPLPESPTWLEMVRATPDVRNVKRVPRNGSSDSEVQAHSFDESPRKRLRL